MATRAILWRKRSLFSSSYSPRFLIHSFLSYEDGSKPPGAEQSTDVGPRKERNRFEAIEHTHRLLSASTLLCQNLGGSISSSSDYALSLGFNGSSYHVQYRLYSSKFRAGMSQEHGGMNQIEGAAPKAKEPSPEECDQAVKGLSRIKAKFKKLQESLKGDQSVLHRVWATILGIGPALKIVASMSREDWANKVQHWKTEFKSTLQHYWLGTKLMCTHVRISMRLLLKLAKGKSLSRRERQQLTRTTADMFRLVPFAVFIIVPFMEFLLPAFLKMFPNMLPSTFQDKMKKQEELKRRLNARIEYAKFLQDTVKEMAKEVQSSQSGDIKKTAEDLDEFMNKVRTGGYVTNDEILNFAKLFNDELTLDNISRPRLVNMCKYMGIQPYSTDHYLRYMLRRKLQEIKEDDKTILAEGVESLSRWELRQACRDRGLLGLLSVQDMRQQLHDWLDLSLKHNVPPSLLILSRAFGIYGRVGREEAVQQTLSSLPDEVVDTVQVTSMPSEDSILEKRRKLELLHMVEERLKEEAKEEEQHARLKETGVSAGKDVTAEQIMDATVGEEGGLDKAEASEKHDQLSELIRALAILASASSVNKEREEFLRLVAGEVKLYNRMVDERGTDGKREAEKAYGAAKEIVPDNQTTDNASGVKVSSALINKELQKVDTPLSLGSLLSIFQAWGSKWPQPPSLPGVDAMLHKLEMEIDRVDAKIGHDWRLLDRDHDGKVTPDEVASAATYLKNTLDNGIQELISKLPKDTDGKIRVKDIVKLASKKTESNRAEAGG